MTITLPGRLTGLMSQIGYDFPKADEDKIAQLGEAWSGIGGKLSTHLANANTSAVAVWDDNTGKDIDSFKTWWEAADSPAKSISESLTGTNVAGQSLHICSTIVIGLKIYIIAELTAAAIALGVGIWGALATGGLSVAAALVIKKALKEAIGWAIEQAVLKILEG